MWIATGLSSPGLSSSVSSCYTSLDRHCVAGKDIQGQATRFARWGKVEQTLGRQLGHRRLSGLVEGWTDMLLSDSSGQRWTEQNVAEPWSGCNIVRRCLLQERSLKEGLTRIGCGRLGGCYQSKPARERSKAVQAFAVLQWNRKPVFAGTAPRVVVITSGKGGVGKTTTTANIGMSLARLNLKVVAIDADVGLRNLDLLLGLENRVNYTAMEVLNGECRLDQALIRDKRWSNFELLCINKPRYKMPLGFGGKALTWLVDALRKRPDGTPDFILIDCPAGIDAGFITAITPANEAILVTTPDITSLRDADRVTGLLECDGVKDIKMVVNRVRSDMIKGEDMMSVLDVQEMLGLPLLGVIPEDSEVIKSTNRGYPLVLKKPPSLAGLALEQAAWRLVEQDSMKAVLVDEGPAKKGFSLPFIGG